MTYNEIMQKVGKRIIPEVYYYSGDTQITISRDNFIEAKPFFNAKLVGTVMCGLSLELKEELPSSATYLKINASYGPYSAYKIYGPYYLKEKPTYNADNKSYSHQLYDAFVTTMTGYQPITISYPTTVLNFFNQLCLECGFTTNIENISNGNREIDHDIYDGINYTYRDVFEDIGQATATLLKIDGLTIKKTNLGTVITTINDDVLKNTNIEFGEHYGPINSVVLSRSADSDSVYLRNEQSVTDNGLCEFKISDNQLMNENNRSDYLQDLLTALDGIEYDLFDCELVGYGGFDILNKIQISTGNNTYNSYVFNNEQSITQGYVESIYTERPEESTTDYKASDTTDKRINQAYIIVNKQNKTITSLTNEISEIREENNNYYTKEQINTLFQNAETGLTNTFKSIGGNNIFRETAPYTINYDNTIPYWNGVIGRINNVDYSSGYALLIKNGVVSQTITLKNGIYSLGFKYRRLIPNSICVVEYNGRTFTLGESGEIATSGEITTGTLTFKITCDTDNGYEIGELMGNIGSQLSTWSQNANESHSDTVNISDGIKVSSSSSNTEATMDTDGFRVRAIGSGNLTLKATDDGIETPEILADKCNIAGLIIQKIDDEIWITGEV